MRINTGNKVEAWCGDPSMGGWRLGVVMWGNGHQYNIRWDGGDVIAGRIRRVSIRPPPPHLEIPDDLEAGDLVEVLDDRMWKLAEFVRARPGGADGEFTVKIVGSPSAVTVPRSMVRVRQVLTEGLDGDLWVATYKGEEIPSAKEPTPRPTAAKRPAYRFVPPPSFSHQWTKIKRSRHTVDHDAVGKHRRIEANSKRIHAMKEEEGELFVGYGNIEVEVINVNEPAAVFVNKQQEMDGEEEGDAAGFRGSDSKNEDAKFVSSAGSGSGSSSSRSSDSDGSRSSSSNSSNSDNSDRAAARSPPGDAQGANQPPPPQGPQHIREERADDVNDRTESSASAMQRPPAFQRPATAAMQRRLEVDAYALLMRVFHATGALTWEKEELLTQLRLQLHISGNEHLQLLLALNGRRPPKPEN